MDRQNPGNSDQITREYFDSLLLEMRLVGSVLPCTEFKLYGETFSTPVMMAALSHLNNCYPNGMVEMAKGASAAKAVMWSGMGDEAELEEIVATGAKTIKIIKPYADEEMLLSKIRHAERCGALAVGIDIDHAFNSKGGYDNVLNYPMTAKSLDDLRRYRKATRLPFVIKGVLSVQDAVKCLEIGVQGIVVSHHHGIMEYAVPPLMILPKIVEAVGHKIPVFVDCGFASGMDVYKAMALGANGVSVGRKVMEYLHADGAKGVENIVASLTQELAGVMARTGVQDLNHFDPSVIWKKNG